jgi:hypothetical protein
MSLAATFRWENISIKDGKIMGVGATVLPFTITLPKGTNPQGNMAMVMSLPAPKDAHIVSFAVYFPESEELLIRAAAATGFNPVTSWHMQWPHPNTFNKFETKSEWLYQLSGHHGKSSLFVAWTGVWLKSPSHRHVGLAAWMSAPGSPLLHDTRMVALFVVYYPHMYITDNE